MKKKLAGLLVLGAAMLTAAACQSEDLTSAWRGGTYDLTIWCAEEVVSLTTSQLNTFVSQYEGTTINFKVEAVGEGDAASSTLTDVTASADIYCFAQDQLSRLVNASALTPIGGTYANQIKENNDGGSVAAASVGDLVYSFPLTSDNGYYMYYDKTVVSADHIDSLTDIIADCKTAGKKIYFEGTSAWYNAAFFFGTGCESTWTTDSSGAFTGYTDDYDSDKGLIAAKGMYELLSESNVYVSGSNAGTGFGSGAAVVVSGTWDYSAAVEALGDNLGCADLPSFTVDGSSYHLGSFSGNKLMGVKPHTDAATAALCNSIAAYLTGYDCQMERFNSKSWGPSNKEAQGSEAVQASPSLAALAAQNEYATPQGQYPGDWWNVAGAIGSSIAASDGSEKALKSILSTYSSSLSGMVTTA